MMRRDNRSNSTADSARRAEEIRRRRTTRSQERVSKVSNRISNPAPARPVIVRGRSQDGSSGFKNAFRSTPLYRQAGTRPRRQFYVAMDSAAGTELRLPAIPMFNPGWRIISAVLALLAAIGLFSLWNSPFFRVSTVEVQGLERLNGADLQAVLRLENLSIVEIQPGQVKDSLAVSFPELADVSVEVALPNAVKVTARERQPILAWKMGDSLRWIDAEGYVFPVRGEAGPLVTINTDDEIPLAPLTDEEMKKLQELAETNPMIATAVAQGGAALAAPVNIPGLPPSGSNITRKADITLLNASLQLIQKLPEGTEVVYDQVNGLGWNDPQGWEVYVGRDLENFESKFAMYQAITEKINSEGIQGVNLISVEHLNAPFYRAEHDVPVEQ